MGKRNETKIKQKQKQGGNDSDKKKQQKNRGTTILSGQQVRRKGTEKKPTLKFSFLTKQCDYKVAVMELFFIQDKKKRTLTQSKQSVFPFYAPACSASAVHKGAANTTPDEQFSDHSPPERLHSDGALVAAPGMLGSAGASTFVC